MGELQHVTEGKTRHFLRISTQKPFELFKQDASEELESTWASFAIKYRWEDEICIISSLGMKGRLRLSDGMILTDARLKRWLPGWFRKKVLSDIQRSMRSVSRYSRVQEAEEESRAQLRLKARETYRDAYSAELEANRLVDRWQILDEATKVLVALTGTGSAVSGWLLWDQPGAKEIWIILAGTASLLSVLHVALRVPERLKDWAEVKAFFGRLRTDLQTFRFDMDINATFAIREFRRNFSQLRSRFRDGQDRRKNDLFMSHRLRRSIGNRIERKLADEERKASRISAANGSADQKSSPRFAVTPVELAEITNTGWIDDPTASLAARRDQLGSMASPA